LPFKGRSFRYTKAFHTASKCCSC